MEGGVEAPLFLATSFGISDMDQKNPTNWTS